MKTTTTIRTIILSVILMLAVAVSSCSKEDEQTPDAGDKIYVCERDGIGGDFIITLYSDGTFSYSEGPACSYIGVGTWTHDGDLITLTDETRVNVFEYDGGELVFKEGGSDNFAHVTLKNGDGFSVMTELNITE